MAILKNFLTKLTVICNDCSNYTVIAGRTACPHFTQGSTLNI